MPISSHLLERAYQLIDANQIQNAELVLDAVVRVDPKNVDAWEAYLLIYQERNDLEWLMERILKTRELNDQDKEAIFAYQDYLIRRMGEKEQDTGEVEPPYTPVVEQDVEEVAEEGMVMFELIEEFNYPPREIEKVSRRKSKKKFVRQIPAPVWYAIALLALFYFGVRLLVLGYLFGYIMMIAFVIGGVFWLWSSGDHKSVASMDVERTYPHESKNELFIIDKPSTVTKRELDCEAPRPFPPHLDE
jgi:hypothetical protein